VKYKLRLPLDGARTHEVVLDPTRPIFSYHLDSTHGMPPGQTGALANTEADEQTPIWQFSRNDGELRGHYKTVEEALAALEKEVNER